MSAIFIFILTTESPPGCPSGPAPRYDMNRPDDTALIINVQSFEDTTEEGVTLNSRRGSHIDFQKLEESWEQFGFTVSAHENLKADKIGEVARETAKKINKNTASSFVCVITTHGDRGKIYGSDSKSLEIKEVTDAFKETNCPSLAGKPKLFFIIASGVRQNFTGGSILEPTGGDDYDHLNDAIFREKLDPDEPHFLIAISLAPGKLKLTPVVFLAITYEKIYKRTRPENHCFCHCPKSLKKYILFVTGLYKSMATFLLTTENFCTVLKNVLRVRINRSTSLGYELGSVLLSGLKYGLIISPYRQG